MKTDIALIVDNVAAAPAVTRVLAVIEPGVDKRRAGFQRVVDREDRRQLLIIDIDQLQRLCCNTILGCRDRGHHVAHVTDFLGCQDFLVTDVCSERARCDSQIVSGEHREHSLKSKRSGRVNAANSGVRQRAT